MGEEHLHSRLLTLWEPYVQLVLSLVYGLRLELFLLTVRGGRGAGLRRLDSGLQWR